LLEGPQPLLPIAQATLPTTQKHFDWAAELSKNTKATTYP